MEPEEDNVAPETSVEGQIFTSMPPPPPPGTERQDLTAVKSFDDTTRGRKFGPGAPNPELISPSKPGEKRSSKLTEAGKRKKRGSMDHKTNVSSSDDEDAMVVDSLGNGKNDSLGDSPGADAPDETPEEKKKRLKREKRLRKKVTDAKKKGKKELTKAIENMDLTNPNAPGAETPGARSSISVKSAKSSNLNRTNSSGRMVKPEKVAKPPFKEVTRFSMAMADGMWLLTDRCCKNDPHPSKEEVISAWEEIRGTEDQGQSVPLPSLQAISTFGSECALKFATANEAFLGNGTKIPNLAAEDPARHSLECRYNSTGRTTVYNVRSTSLVGREGVVAALRECYPRDKIRLYQAHLKGVKLDNWAIKFEKPPQTTTGQLSFPGTEVAGRGPWKSLVVAASENCDYCGQSLHGENLNECRSLSFVQHVEPAPINYF